MQENAAERPERQARRCRGDRGDVMLMTVVLIIFLMAGAWALVSASQQWGARREAQATAAAAARAAAAVTPAEIRNGVVTISSNGAQQRAAAVWSAAGYSGSVAVSGLTVTVSVTAGVDYAFPAPGFPGAVTGSASSTAVRGVQGDEGG
ncbi:MAG TPA: pilus assembly protein TadG-related protein [Jiangellaceae bacterium]